MRHTKLKTVLAIGGGIVLALGAPLAASAHITVTPYTATPGSYALVTFKVPNESGTAITTKVEIDIPGDTAFADVSYVPLAGWTAEAETTTLSTPIKVTGNEQKTGVTKVTFTADAGNGIHDGQLQLFQLSVGPVPDVGRVYLPTSQTYSDGTVVAWDQKSAGAEHPSPVLYVNDAPVVSDDSDAEVTAASQAELAPQAGTDTVARVIGIAGLVVGLVGIVLFVTGRRKPAAK
ncbi:MAG: YcnI family protein [Actinomycetota bacterium]